jgi:hypothetical protein
MIIENPRKSQKKALALLPNVGIALMPAFSGAKISLVSPFCASTFCVRSSGELFWCQHVSYISLFLVSAISLLSVFP